jgi:MoaA/NifB/PqqE/SkfB family radical SAM enzyme
MKIKDYADFSFSSHTRQAGAFSDCRFEITFKCGLNCRHCLTSCYNQKRYLDKELDFRQIKNILDELAQLGVFWLCFSGGDPLRRKDFSRIYSYAYKKGFLITVFTSGYDLNSDILDLWKKMPPFNLEITVNACRKDIYEQISGVPGSFKKAMAALDKLRKAKIPLLAKCLVTRLNINHLPKLKQFFRSRNIRLIPDFMVYPRLNGDLKPCALRIKIPKGQKNFCAQTKARSGLFTCAAVSNNSLHIDSWGNVYFCNLLRQFKASAIKLGVAKAWKKGQPKASAAVKGLTSSCLACGFRLKCNWCPGVSYL